MLPFSYKAVNAEGEVVEGEIVAANRDQVIARLRDRALIPIRAEPARPAAAGRSWLSRLQRRRAGEAEIALLTRSLATLIEARLPLDKALSVAREAVPSDAGRALGAEILDAVRRGSSLADAFGSFPDSFPSFYVGMVRAGERGGTLGQTMAVLATTLERAQATRGRVLSALIYPSIVLLMAGISIVVLVAVVVPEFQPLFEEAGSALPLSTRVLISASDFLAGYGWLALLAAAAAAAYLRRLAHRPAARLWLDSQLLRLPRLGALLLYLDLSRFSRIAGSLLAGGVDLVSTLDMARSSMRNAALAAEVSALRPRVSRGERLGNALAQSRRVPNLLVQLVRAGEESGTLSDMLLHVAEIYDKESEQRIERTLALLVPVVTIVLGLIVGAVIGSIFSAILSTYHLPF